MWVLNSLLQVLFVINFIVVSVLFDICGYVKHGGRFVKHAANLLRGRAHETAVCRVRRKLGSAG